MIVPHGSNDRGNGLLEDTIFRGVRFRLIWRMATGLNTQTAMSMRLLRETGR
jgi:hypothetical protein